MALRQCPVQVSEGDGGTDVGPVSEVLHSPMQLVYLVLIHNSEASCDDSSLPAVHELPARRHSQPKHLADYVC